MNKILIKKAAAIVSCDKDNSLYKDCDILIEGPLIKEIGHNLTAEDAEIIHAEGKYVYPGLVNTHHHFFQTFVRNQMAVDYPSLSVMDWIEKIYEIFKLMTSDGIYYSSLVAMTDLVKHGCTTAFDHQYCYPRHAGKELVDRQFEAADLLGIRYHAGRGANTLPKSEGSLIPGEMLESTDEFLKDCERLAGLYHDRSDFSMKQVVVSPCQPINCYEATFRDSVILAREQGMMLHTHLGEGENEGMVQRFGKRTLEWCHDLDFTGSDVWFAHGWELTPEEYRVMAETDTGLSHCPAPAVLGGFPILDIPAMTDAGMRLSLGCDGSATNDSSSLLDSLRMAYTMQSWHGKQRGSVPSPAHMLKIASQGGASVLGRKDLGSLEVGKGADLFMIDTRRLELSGALHDPACLIARAGVTGPVDLTMVNGKTVWENGQLPGIDEGKLAEEAEAACTGIIRVNSLKPENWTF